MNNFATEFKTLNRNIIKSIIKMKKFGKAVLLASIFGMSFLNANAQMSDQQIITYVKNAKAAGKSDEQLGRELMARGVSRDQLEQLKQRYEKKQYNQNQTNYNTTETTDNTRLRNQNNSLYQSNSLYDFILNDTLSLTEADTLQDKNIKKIFGHNIFQNKELTFEPNENMATPADYRLGPGDEVIIDIWGNNEATIRQTISPDGQIIVSQVGPIYLSGLTISEANEAVKQTLSSIYSGITSDSPQSQVSITLGKIRSIQVNVMGEVKVPGTYRLSSFSTVFNALYRAGGVSSIGSLRDIKVMRAGTKVGSVDVYDYILNGKINDDIRLQEGDVIVVPPYSMLVDVEGNIKRPMYYEMKQGETMESLIDYAGGFTGDAYKDEVKLFRRNGRENRIFSVTAANFAGWQLADGDSISVSPILDRFSNRVEIQGAVYRPGMFELGNGISTVKELIERADGLTGDAFTGRAVLTREKEDMTNEVLSVDLAGIINGTSPDIPLRREDVLVISSKKEIEAQGGISVFGEVTNPGVIPFAENTSIEDIILKAGGLLDGASTVRVDISRRIKDPKSINPSEKISEVYTFALKDGFIVDGNPSFTLEPYDIVEVRRSPGYQIQRRVNIAGEAVFTGGYTLTKKNERISDLVRRAGGVTKDAYVRGGRLIRKMNDEEKAQQESAVRMAMMNAGADSLSLNKIQLAENYVVGIELDKALANPGSGYDIVLREGDYLYIPEFTSTIKITGEVQFPNTVAYVPGKKLSHYIEQAGGYSRLAKKSSVYIVHMNGTVSRVKRMRKVEIEPGCQIIVPSKKERRPMTLAEIMSLGTSAASLGTMAATLYNLFKK